MTDLENVVKAFTCIFCITGNMPPCLDKNCYFNFVFRPIVCELCGLFISFRQSYFFFIIDPASLSNICCLLTFGIGSMSKIQVSLLEIVYQKQILHCQSAYQYHNKKLINWLLGGFRKCLLPQLTVDFLMF